MTKSQILNSLLLCMTALSYAGKVSALTGSQLRAEHVPGNPIQSMVIVSAEGSGSKLCGGLLISKKHVLTALHCVNDIERANQVRIFFPKKDAAASTSTGLFGKENRQARAIHEPPSASLFHGTTIPLAYNDYNVGAPVVDIAVIELAEPAPEEVVVFPVQKIATDEELRFGSLSAFGWDSREYSYNGSSHKSLYRREDPLVRLSDSDLLRQFFSSDIKMYCLRNEVSLSGKCESSTLMRKLYGHSTSSYKILISTPGSICQGDSGSPLFVKTRGGEYKLLGLTSSGFALNGRILTERIVGEFECSPHSFYQTIAPLKNWLQSFVR